MAQGLNPHKRRTAVIACAPSSTQVLQHLQRVAPSSASVLITGESGTGKELIARYVHEHSGRRGPFVAVNCGALSPALAEAELFGHEAGAFTGASGHRVGWFEAAEGGTLFLDEISELPAELQVKLLRVLQEGELTRLGSRRTRAINVRFVAATNVDLPKAVAEGRFRADLFYRLNVATVTLAPLRERYADILPLAEHFLTDYSSRMRKDDVGLLPEAQQALLEYSWPGNVRELENVIQRAVLVCADGAIHPRHLRLRETAPDYGEREVCTEGDEPSAFEVLAGPLDKLLRSEASQLFPRVEEFLVRRAWSHCQGNQVLTARLLGIPRNVMRSQLRRYGLIGTETGGELLVTGTLS